jgi:hypothetical protein
MAMPLSIIVGILLVWNAIYCGWKIVGDFRTKNTVQGALGLVALASPMSLVVIALLIERYGS